MDIRDMATWTRKATHADMDIMLYAYVVGRHSTSKCSVLFSYSSLDTGNMYMHVHHLDRGLSLSHIHAYVCGPAVWFDSDSSRRPSLSPPSLSPLFSVPSEHHARPVDHS